jgi:hypothetical protein
MCAVAERLVLRVAAPAQVALAGLLDQGTVGGEDLDHAGHLEGAVGQGLDGDFTHEHNLSRSAGGGA